VAKRRANPNAGPPVGEPGAGPEERRLRVLPARPMARKKALLDKIRDRDSLAGADLRFLWFVHWDLSGRDLRAANLRGTQLSGGDLSGCNLRSAVLAGANLSGASLRGAQLEDADLEGALVQGADFRGASGLTKATLDALEGRGAIVGDAGGVRSAP
jgi:uncharacterized protein YjbI with pentapeptide repeats